MRVRSLLLGVLVLLPTACGGPDQAERLVAALRGYIPSVQSAIRVDPSWTTGEEGLVPAPPELQSAVEAAMADLGIEKGDARAAQECARFVSSLGVPEVVELSPEWPENCESLEEPVFVLSVDEEGVHGQGWSRDWGFRFSAQFLGGDDSARITEARSFPNRM